MAYSHTKKESTILTSALISISLLISLLLSFNILAQNVHALHVVVHDEDEQQLVHDFLITDEHMRVLANQGNISNVYDLLGKTAAGYKGINYIDIKNVKFFYSENGTIIAELLTNDDTNYNFTDGTTYGMAININSFPNPARPLITDADYIYKFVYNNGTWDQVLTIQHMEGDEKPLSSGKLDEKEFNEQNHFVRMKFDTNKIGKPDEFQIQFFGWTKARISGNESYSLIDVIPWIEVPTPDISMSLNPTISKVYPWESTPEKIMIKSTSAMSTGIKLCQDENCNVPNCDAYCWNFTRGSIRKDGIVLTPPANFGSIDVTLNTRNVDHGKQRLEMFANIYPIDVTTRSNLPDKKLQVWDLDVGDHNLENFQNLANLPNVYPYMISILIPLGTFIGGVFVDKKELTRRIKRLTKRKNHR